MYGELSEKIIKNISEHYTERTIGFEIEFTSEKIVDELLLNEEKFEKLLSLRSIIKFNLYAYGPDNKIKKYKSPLEMIEDYYKHLT